MLKPSSDASRGGDERSCKCPEPGKPETWAFFSAPKNDVDVIAHRGGADQWPGETIFAFENAEEIGVDVLELDIWGTLGSGSESWSNADCDALQKTLEDYGELEITAAAAFIR